MNKKISPHDFRASLNRRLSALQADPFLARRIIAEEKRRPVSRKKTVLMVLTAVVLIALAAGALAYALDAFGIIDFVGRQANTFVPPQYADSIAQLNQSVETGFGSGILQEAYYDGKVLRLTAYVVPKGKMLLIGGDISPADPMENSVSDLEGQRITVAQYAVQHYEGRLAEVCLSAAENETCAVMMHEDGSATLYLECIFEDVQAYRETEVKLSYIPIRLEENTWGLYDFSGRETAAVIVSLHASETETYACIEGMAFPAAGVKVNCVEMTITPLEIRYTIDYEVMDVEGFSAQQGGLWFEFVRADENGAYQRVSDGMYSFESCGRLDGAFFAPDEVGTVYRQTGSLGLDAMSGTYTIRAYNAREKIWYEMHTFDVKESDK